MAKRALTSSNRRELLEKVGDRIDFVDDTLSCPGPVHGVIAPYRLLWTHAISLVYEQVVFGSFDGLVLKRP